MQFGYKNYIYSILKLEYSIVLKFKIEINFNFTLKFIDQIYLTLLKFLNVS